MTRTKVAVAAALCALLLTSRAVADPPPAEPPAPCEEADRCALRLTKGAQTPGGLVLPPGYYLTPETWQRLDDELRRLQEAETRLAAEREVLVKKARPTWWWAAGALAAGIAAGWALSR